MPEALIEIGLTVNRYVFIVVVLQGLSPLINVIRRDCQRFCFDKHTTSIANR